MTRQSHHRPKGGFENPWPNSKVPGFRDVLRWSWQRRWKSVPPNPPPGTFPIVAPTFGERVNVGDLAATWVGHATVLLQVDGLNVLTDPMWSRRASPVRFAGPKRLVPAAVKLEDLPPIDIVLVSHNHYDHLDKRTVKRLSRRHPGAEWIMPLGLAEMVMKWGAKRVRELDWWAELTTRGASFACTPAQHFSARGVGDRGRSLWCGWAIHTARHRLFFAGDTGYHPTFGEIAARYGPFDLLLLPIGAYDPRWFMEPVHMDPDEALAAYRDLGGRGAVLPVHWGTFRLTDEAMTEPPERFRAAWENARLDSDDLWLLRHGETRVMDASRR
jgi:N-acyl-phosphatidylethanolamine-hydrolysing phospholipase D